MSDTATSPERERPAAEPVAVIGTGTMGAGIAQVAALAGHPVWLFDAAPKAAERAASEIRARVAALISRGRLGADVQVELHVAEQLSDLSTARWAIEAVVEELGAKQELLAAVEKVVSNDCILATNTSSLSPTAIAAGLDRPDKFVGIHFFNPVPLMRLVEVAPGLQSSDATVAAASELAASWGKVVVHCGSTPGYIVNRLARPFYGEALRALDERTADAATIDAVLKSAAGFRMGPFELMDLIGLDVNDAVTRSIWAAFNYDPRFSPSFTQRELVAAGWLGRKTGRGFFTYDPTSTTPSPAVAQRRAEPTRVLELGDSELGGILGRATSAVEIARGDTDGEGYVQLPSGAALVRCGGRSADEIAARRGRPVILVDRTLDDLSAAAVAVSWSRNCSPAGVDEGLGLLQASGLDVYVVRDTPGLIVTRTIAMLVNLAVDALHFGVADAAAIDTAMQLGANYPLGPLAWGERWGPATVLTILDDLDANDRSGRYRASILLRSIVTTGSGSLSSGVT